jgi:hypothetical protein
MDEDWNSIEVRWIRRAKKLLREKPPSVLLYTLDGEIYACKDGVDSGDCIETVAPCGTIGVGCVITDIHDDSGHGSVKRFSRWG